VKSNAFWRFTRAISTGSKPIALVLTFVSIWLVFVAIPRNLFWIYRVWSLGDRGGQISIYFLHFQYYVGALSLGFSVFVAIRVIQLVRKNFHILQGVFLPPYSGTHTSQSPLPTGSEFKQVDIKRRLQISIVAFVMAYVVIFIVFNTVYYNLTSIGQYLESISESSNLLLGIFESLLIVSSDHIIDGGTQEMNPESLAGNLFLLWIPATIHLIGFANLSGLVYDAYRRIVCEIMVAIVDR